MPIAGGGLLLSKRRLSLLPLSCLCSLCCLSVQQLCQALDLTSVCCGGIAMPLSTRRHNSCSGGFPIPPPCCRLLGSTQLCPQPTGAASLSLQLS